MVEQPALPRNIRRAVAKVTERLFVGPDATSMTNANKAIRRGNEYMTSLPLQMLLYFNCFFSPIWLISSVITYQAKYEYLDSLYKVVVISVQFMMAFVEIIRLYLGYLGNLTEKVPELAGCWLLTFLLELPASLFLLLNEATIILPIERAMHLVYAVFVILEVIIGGIALKIMVNNQVTLFHLQQFVKNDIESSDEPTYNDQKITHRRTNPTGM